MPFSRLICATDFSEPSRRALDTALRIARGTDAPLTLLHVVEPPRFLVPELAWSGSGLDETMAAEAERSLGEERARALALQPGVAIEVLQVRGVAWDRIVAVARDRRHDLIVVGSHGRSGLRHALLGSVAERVVRHAPAPVLVVPMTLPAV